MWSHWSRGDILAWALSWLQISQRIHPIHCIGRTNYKESWVLALVITQTQGEREYELPCGMEEKIFSKAKPCGTEEDSWGGGWHLSESSRRSSEGGHCPFHRGWWVVWRLRSGHRPSSTTEISVKLVKTSVGNLVSFLFIHTTSNRYLLNTH